MWLSYAMLTGCFYARKYLPKSVDIGFGLRIITNIPNTNEGNEMKKNLNNYLKTLIRPCKEKYGAWNWQHRILIQLIKATV